MKKFKRIMAVTTITGALFASSIPSAFAEEPVPAPTNELPPLETGEGLSPFKDANGTRYGYAVWFMWINGITQGKSETRFGVSEPLKRVDAAMIIGNYGIEGLNQNPKTAPFTDLPQRAVRMISALYDAGIINGKSKTLFGSNDTITRGEAAIILSRSFGDSLTAKPTGESKGIPARWNDVPPNWDAEKSDKFSDVTGRYVEPVHTLYNAGIVKGKTESRFGTADPLTRGELALMIHAIFEAQTSSDVEPELKPSVHGELPSSADSISLTLDKESYSKSETPKIIVKNDNPSHQSFSPTFALEKQGKDGLWFVVPFNKELMPPAMIHVLEAGKTHEEPFSLEDNSFEKPLKAGEYRLVQTFTNIDDIKLNTTLAAEFTITE